MDLTQHFKLKCHKFIDSNRFQTQTEEGSGNVVVPLIEVSCFVWHKDEDLILEKYWCLKKRVTYPDVVSNAERQCDSIKTSRLVINL